MFLPSQDKENSHEIRMPDFWRVMPFTSDEVQARILEYGM